MTEHLVWAVLSAISMVSTHNIPTLCLFFFFDLVRTAGNSSVADFLKCLFFTDASVTQSALEDALLSNMQHGGMASRMSTISNALRSKYL